MPKVTKYKQKFRKCWLDDPILRDWLLHIQDNKSDVLQCKWCGTKLANKYSDLKHHASRARHLSNRPPSLEKEVEQVEIGSDTKVAEAVTALFIAEHCALRTSDHLSQLYRNIFKDSPASAKFKMGRSKCTAILRNVWHPHSLAGGHGSC